ncbi:MAG: hypothetical protein M3R00_00290 [Pseudomonadota bacterium]|nr:hypothetical protein [Pseudomonadota bacterium]
MKTLLLSLTSCAIVGLSGVAVADTESPLLQNSPTQQYSSADSDESQSSGASAGQLEPPATTDPETPVTATEAQAAESLQAPTLAQQDTPASPSTQDPAAKPQTSNNPSTEQKPAVKQPNDPSYDEDGTGK